MNLLNGEIVFSAAERDAVLKTLDKKIAMTLQESELNQELVLSACDALSKTIAEEHVEMLTGVGLPNVAARRYIAEAKLLLSRESLEARLKRELSDSFASGGSYIFNEKGSRITEKLMPLGILLHIAAGNQYGLAFFSVIEGLLAGNINLVKLPGNDDGLSAMIFAELFKLEPRLKDYVYLFDYSSKEEAAIRSLMDLSDAVVVWGGDSAVSAVRRLTPPAMRIIEWGHKMSFAYITMQGATAERIKGLAENIVETNQLLCSSCQGIFLDTESVEELHSFCEDFLPVLERAREAAHGEIPQAIQAQTGLLVYTERLKAAKRPCRVFQSGQSSLLAYDDAALETAISFGNCWVKRLPREMISETIRPHKNHLQTAALLCGGEEREELTKLLWTAGVTRVTSGEQMSRPYASAAHDGEYTLRRYTRIVSQEF